MHVILTNDDGPPNDSHSPYIRPFVDAINALTDWKLTIVVPEQQRSWIGKAHIIGQEVGATYLYTRNVGSESQGPFTKPDTALRDSSQWREWTLLAGTPASCANIGVIHVGPARQSEPVDLVLSGPNFGRNTSAAYIMSSGTVGASLEAAVCGKRSIALSFSYTKYRHEPEDIAAGCVLAIRLIKHLLADWHPDVQVYSINIPLFAGLDADNPPPINYTPILQNQWTAIFDRQADPETQAETFKWAPNYAQCDETVYKAGPGSDAWAVLHNEVSISPIRGVFHGVNVGSSHVQLKTDKHEAYVDNTDPYVFTAWSKALKPLGIEITDHIKPGILEYADYDNVDFEKRSQRLDSLVYAYVYRKALTRKNYLGRTVAHYVAKNPQSVLKSSVPESFDLEVDYAEFLDDALDESCELRHELESNSDKLWILKPALGDRAHGIQVFRTVEELQNIFDEMEESQTDEDTRMRQYVVQECLTDLLLVDGHKFHVRVYILCAGSLKVWVYRDALALFAGQTFDKDSTDLKGHLTNTCIQGESARVERLSDLESSRVPSTKIMDNICKVTGELFNAAIADPINFQSIPNAFEFYGLDFLVGSDATVHLLEVNAYPDFKQTGQELSYIVQGFFDAAAAEVVAPFYGVDASVIDTKQLELVFDKEIH